MKLLPLFAYFLLLTHICYSLNEEDEAFAKAEDNQRILDYLKGECEVNQDYDRLVTCQCNALNQCENDNDIKKCNQLLQSVTEKIIGYGLMYCKGDSPAVERKMVVDSKEYYIEMYKNGNPNNIPTCIC